MEQGAQCGVFDFRLVNIWMETKYFKKGGLSHLSHDPRKPFPLGTMIRNAAECTPSIFLNHDIIDSSTTWKKKYSDPAVKSYLPNGGDISHHMTEVLCQAVSSQVVEGQSVGCDAWLG